MSIVNRYDERVFLTPRRRQGHVFKEPVFRERNRRWLETQRHFGLTVRATASFLNRPLATVQTGIAAALDAEQAEIDRASLGYDESPVVDARSGITEDDIAYIQETYPQGTAIGDHPDVVAFLALHDSPQRAREVA